MDDLIRRKDVLDLLIQEEHRECEDWRKYDDEASFGAMNAYSRMRKLFELLPSAQSEYITFQLIQDIYDVIKKAECGDSYIVLDGETIVTDTAYALEGIEMFYELIKKRCGKND